MNFGSFALFKFLNNGKLALKMRGSNDVELSNILPPRFEITHLGIKVKKNSSLNVMASSMQWMKHSIKSSHRYL